jgi:hypothetical protein
MLPLDRPLPASAEIQLVPSPYKELDWNKGFRYTDSPSSFSIPNRAISQVQTEVLFLPRISITGNVQYFNMRSAAFSCQLQLLGAVPLEQDCTITAIGTKTNGGTVSAAFKYTAGPMKSFPFPSTFTNLKSVLFDRSGGLVPDTILFTAYDSIIYDVVKTC